MKSKVVSWGGVLAAMIFCVWLTLWVRPMVNLLPDSTYYLSFAKNIRQGKFYIDHRAGVDRYITAPFYPLLITAFSGLTGNVEGTGRVVSLAANLLLILVTFFWARKMFGPWAGVMAAWMVACSHPRESIQVLTESFFALLYVAAVWQIWEAVTSGRIKNSIIAGILTALATLTRELGIVAVPFGVVAMLIGARGGEGKLSVRERVLAAFSFSVVWCAFMAPYWIYSLYIRGTWWGSRFSERLAHGDAQYVKTDAFDMLYQLVSAAHGIWGLYPGYVTLAAVFGLIVPWKLASGRDGFNRVFILFWVVINVFALDLLGINTQGLWLRYLFPMGPFILILAVRGVTVVGESVGWVATLIKPSVTFGARAVGTIVITASIVICMFAGVSAEREQKLVQQVRRDLI